MLTKLLYTHRFTFFLWLIFFLGGAIFTIFTNPETAILFFNAHYSGLLTEFFILATKMAEVLGFCIALLWIALTSKNRDLLGFLASGLMTLILVWFFKNYIFDHAIRPIVYLEQLGISLENRSSYTLNRQHSFPSGHTTAAFAYFFYVALVRSGRIESVIALSLAVLAGISRIYLAQHFPGDVVAGCVLGTCIAILGYIIFHRASKEPHKTTKLDLFVIPPLHEKRS